MSDPQPPAPRWVPAPDVTYTKLDEEEAVLLNLETKQYFSLNETGLLIWERLQEQSALADVAAALSQSYDVEQEAALRYVRRFVETLRQDGLVTAQAPS